MGKRRMSFESDDHQDQEEASRKRKLRRRNRNQEEEEAPIPANPNQEAPIPPEGLLFEKKVTSTDAKRSELSITGAHRATVMAFLTDAEREKVVDGGLRVATDANGVEYTLELKRNTTRSRSRTYLSNGWAAVARANEVKKGDSVQGIGSRAGGQFRLKLNIISAVIEDDSS